MSFGKEMYMTQSKQINKNLNPGHAACPGCGASIAMNLASSEFHDKTVMVIVASCWSVIAGQYPFRTLNFPAMHSAFACGAAVGTGVIHGLKARGDDDARVVVWAGDGGTFDIGLQSLSGAVERNTPFTYICYDNEAYMNTGIQRSSATPTFAETTTTPGKNIKSQPKKDLIEIFAAHNIPYAATASIAYPEDLKMKVRKAVNVNGPSLIHIFSPCSTGQGYPEKFTVKVSRKAVQTGVFPLYEYENGEYRVTLEPRMDDVEEYITMQKRFKHIDNTMVDSVRATITNKWKLLRQKVAHSNY